MKLNLSIILTILTVVFISCSPQNADDRFAALSHNFLEQYVERYPETATNLGDHRYDNRMNDYSLASVQRDRAFTQSYLDSLADINPDRLSTTNRIDYQILKTNLEATIFQLDSLREYEWNPLVYNVGNGIYALIAREFAPLEARLVNVRERLKQVPGILEHAKSNLKNPPKVHTETAILQNGGTLGMIRDELNQFVDQVPGLKGEFSLVQTEAVAALEAYGRWLREELLPKSTGDFRIGDSKFRRKLAFTLESDLPKEEILRRAEGDLKESQGEMYATALELHKTFFPKTGVSDRKAVIKAVLDRLAQDRPTDKTIVGLAEQNMKEVTQFVREKNLITLPEEPVQVIVMPEFRRGVAIAYCDAPGPLEQMGETFYAISPTPKDWDSKRKESFYREYNNYMLRDLTIHEGTPGHYLQIAHSNKFSAPTRIRAVFSSGPFVEGWAVYAEQFMVEFGYGGPEVKMQQLKMRLRVIINAIIDQKIHTAGMTEQEALDLMMNEGFQELGEASGKWRRASLTSTQLSTYYVGNVGVNDIRKAYETKMSGNMDIKAMHDQMLSFGSPAAKYVKELMGL
ncbi:MAG TPA: DUF885 domain-containing protein [Bacteroidota bacterium]